MKFAAPHVRPLLWSTLQTIFVWISRKPARDCFDIQKAMSAISQATWCMEIALNSLNPLKLWGLRMPQSILELQHWQKAGLTPSLPSNIQAFAGLRWGFQISVFILGGFMHASFELFSPFFEVQTQDGETVCLKAAGAVKASSICYWTKCFVFPLR